MLERVLCVLERFGCQACLGSCHAVWGLRSVLHGLHFCVAVVITVAFQELSGCSGKDRMSALHGLCCCNAVKFQKSAVFGNALHFCLYCCKAVWSLRRVSGVFCNALHFSVLLHYAVWNLRGGKFDAEAKYDRATLTDKHTRQRRRHTLPSLKHSLSHTSTKPTQPALIRKHFEYFNRKKSCRKMNKGKHTNIQKNANIKGKTDSLRTV